MATIAVDAPSRVRTWVSATLFALTGLALIVPFEAATNFAHALTGGEDAALHRMHELAITSNLLLFIAAGLLGSVIGAARRPALAAMAGIGTIALTVFLVAVRLPDPAAWATLGLIATAIALHPARREVFGAGARPSRLIAAAAAGLGAIFLTNAAQEIVRQISSAGTSDPHAAVHHYLAEATFGMALTGIAFMTALRIAGYRITGWIAGLTAALYGAMSLVYAGTTSAFSAPVAVLAIIAGAGLVTAVEWQARRDA